MPHEETLYYERMMFVLHSAKYDKSDKRTIDAYGNRWSKSLYNKDNLNKKTVPYNILPSLWDFRLKVCSNLCIWSDGVNLQIKVGSKEALGFEIRSILESYNPEEQLAQYDQWQNLYLKEVQFAHILGKCRMFQHLKPIKEMVKFLLVYRILN